MDHQSKFKITATLVAASRSTLLLTHLDCLESRLCLMVHGGEGQLQNLPAHGLTATRLAHQHGGVSRVFGLVKLDDFGHGERGHLQPATVQLRLYDLLQLKHPTRVSKTGVESIKTVLSQCLAG